MILWLSFSFNLSAANHYDCRKPRSCDLGFLQFAVVPEFLATKNTKEHKAFVNSVPFVAETIFAAQRAVRGPARWARGQAGPPQMSSGAAA